METLCIILLLLTGAAARADGVIVLVPGFFNSLAPGSLRGPYFSATIVKTAQKYAKVYVADTLQPVGGVAQNSELLATYLSEVQAQNPDQSITVLAHSAGGLYTLQALTSHPDLPVRTVVTLATPFAGSALVESIAHHLPVATTLANYFNMQSLEEFRPERAAEVMAGLRIPSGVRVVALAGTQQPCFMLTCSESKYLSWVLTLAQELFNAPSDGIVSRESAMANGIVLRGVGATNVTIEQWQDFDLALEHWEMVVESQLFSLIGVEDTNNIALRQREVYGKILQRLGFVAR